MVRKSLLLLAVGAAVLPVPARPAPAAEVAVIRYEVRGRGNTAPLEEFAAAAAETYADPRGWSAGGALRLEQVISGGDFVLWLAADAEMPSFGGACDHMWSCRSGNNVVVNEDRWLGGSPAWNGGGAPLRDYRHMVVNHETGHWLLQGHEDCAGPGQPAPVMQQQSMDLQGCVANPWPLRAELRPVDTGERVRSLGGRGNVVVQSGVVQGAEPEVRSAPSHASCDYVPWRTTRLPCL